MPPHLPTISALVKVAKTHLSTTFYFQINLLETLLDYFLSISFAPQINEHDISSVALRSDKNPCSPPL